MKRQFWERTYLRACSLPSAKKRQPATSSSLLILLRAVASLLAIRMPGVNLHPDAVDLRNQIGILKLAVLRTTL